jgi:hypothetical protein
LEKKTELSALQEILQYSGGIRGPEDGARDKWTQRFNLLDAGCKQFHIRGILDYQGKSWTEIFHLEKRNHWVGSEHTLDRRLNLLVAQELAMRDPPSRGRGHRGKYYFTMPHAMLKGIDGHPTVPMSEMIGDVRHYVESGSSREEKAQKIADILELLVLNFACGLDLLLRRLVMAKKSIHEKELFRTMNNESYELDLLTDFVAMRILMIEFPDLAQESLKAFEERLRHDWADRSRP